MKSKFYVAILIALIVDIILYSIYPVFNKVSPELLGLPFFYWYQTIMLAVTSAIFFGISYAVKEVE
ncbi:DUF3311 domain-containing protein [Acidianus sulfidivorans JP7]|uniref:DUF3311 domain-containing protein n=1 Tax=Acidianus sulfidivorans JP7 TaxID=619593 RepID=A0A2U9IJQ6_9CREN|nr:DUF3311 domain-containing protein [Acidianus sulfidivorans]AWR96186.1 DUF3311 domain-containing protein [Acidianus sulfidivorans JP7]